MSHELTFDQPWVPTDPKVRRWWRDLPRGVRRLLRPWMGIWTTPRTWNDLELVTDIIMNLHVRDNFRALNPTTMTAYTPIWSSSGTQPDLNGTGTLTGLHYAIGSFVHFRIKLEAGAATTFGTGGWAFTLPFAAEPFPNAGAAIGSAAMLDSGTEWRTGVAMLASTTEVQVLHDEDSGTGVSATTPFTWADGDELHIDGVMVKA